MSYSSMFWLCLLWTIRWGKSSVQRKTHQRMLIKRDKPNFRYRLYAHGEQFVARGTATKSIRHRGDIIPKAAPGGARPALCVQVGWAPLNRPLLQVTTAVYLRSYRNWISATPRNVNIYCWFWAYSSVLKVILYQQRHSFIWLMLDIFLICHLCVGGHFLIFLISEILAWLIF